MERIKWIYEHNNITPFGYGVFFFLLIYLACMIYAAWRKDKKMVS